MTATVPAVLDTESAFQEWLDLHPDDHTARLVFADWLEEHGDAAVAANNTDAAIG